MIEVEISKLKIDENQYDQIIVLKEKDGSRILPLVIGIQEITAIKLKLSGLELPRPMTHDLTLNLVHELGATIDSAIIHKLEDETYFATLKIRQKDQLINLDARPSDCVALVMREKAKLFCEESLLE